MVLIRKCSGNFANKWVNILFLAKFHIKFCFKNGSKEETLMYEEVKKNILLKQSMIKKVRYLLKKNVINFHFVMKNVTSYKSLFQCATNTLN